MNISLQDIIRETEAPEPQTALDSAITFVVSEVDIDAQAYLYVVVRMLLLI